MSNLIPCSACGLNVPKGELMPDRTGNLVCTVCQEKVVSTAPTIKIFEKSGKYEFIYTDLFGFQRRDTKQTLVGVPGVIEFTDDDVVIQTGFVKVINNWVLDFNPEDSRYVKFTQFMKRLSSRELIPPMPLIVTMQQMGSLKMRISLIMRSSDVNDFNTWKRSSEVALLN